jgi:DNA-binding Xre family transcriptional regulator
MKVERVQKKTAWTAEDKARHKAVREKFKDKPTYEQLVAAGECAGQPVPLGVYLAVGVFLHDLRKAREDAGLSLTDVENRTGIDKATLSRLETGKQTNPTVDTLVRYAAAVGKQLVLTLQDMPKTP